MQTAPAKPTNKAAARRTLRLLNSALRRVVTVEYTATDATGEAIRDAEINLARTILHLQDALKPSPKTSPKGN